MQRLLEEAFDRFLFSSVFYVTNFGKRPKTDKYAKMANNFLGKEMMSIDLLLTPVNYVRKNVR